MKKQVERKKKTERKFKFWHGFAIYAAVMLVAVIALYVYVWNTMKKYEKAQPEKIMETLIADLEQGEMDSISVVSGTKFEPDLNLKDDFKENIKNKELSYRVTKTGTDSMEYDINSGKEKVAHAVVKSSNNRKILGILAIADWSISEVKPVESKEGITVKITIPEQYEASINGVLLSGEEQIGETAPIDGAEHVKEYIGDNVPKVKTYQVKGLAKAPEISVNDNFGNKVDVGEISDYSDINVTYAAQAMPADLESYAYEAAVAYSNFFSRDLAGCSQSTECLQKYFVQNSYYIDLAEQYRVGDMWMYSRHDTPVFTNTGVTEYIPYNEQCFSCRVYFDKTMYLTSTGETRKETTDQTYYFVNTDGKWLIADIKTNN